MSTTAALNPYFAIRTIAARHKIATAVIAGLVATHFATMWGYWFHGVGLPVLDWNTTNGIQLLPKASHNVQFFTGLLAHYTTGVCFALVYAFGIHPLIPLRDTALGNLAKATAFGTLLALLSANIMLPLVFYPEYHLGFFSHNFGFKGVLAVFVWHWIYGLNLGAIYNPLPEDEVLESHDSLSRSTAAVSFESARARAGDAAVPEGA